jgi:hypothetical protein
MEESGCPLGRAATLYNRTQHCNGRLGLEVYPAQISETQRFGAPNGSFAQRLSSA